MALTRIASVLAAGSVSLVACASKLPRKLTHHAPEGGRLEAELDMSLVEVKELKSGEVVNLGRYMETAGKDHLLLTFGSRDCAACNDKAGHLTTDVIGRHPVYLTEPGRKFEIVGVNTDHNALARGEGYFERFSFIRWSDPSGRVMLRYFMPTGRNFQVPLTVLVTRRGIAWSILPDETVSVPEIMRRVEATLAVEETSEEEETDPPDPPPPVTPSDLAFIGPGRLEKVSATSCTGKQEPLGPMLGEATYRVVGAARGPCRDKACERFRDELKATQASLCQPKRDDVGQPLCAVAFLVGSGADLSKDDCASGIAAAGSDPFFDVFASHFDWSYPRRAGQEFPELTHGVDGPLLFVFDGEGHLVHSSEGPLEPGALAALLASSDLEQGVPSGPDFPLWNADRKELGFKDVWSQARYTVVAADRMFTSIPCGPCEEELKRWSQPGGLLDYCAASNRGCQAVLLETSNVPAGGSLASLYAGVMGGGADPDDPSTHVEGVTARGIRLPVVLDPVPADDDGYLKRFYDGYMMAASPELGYGGRVFVYDQEGRVVAKFISGGGENGVDPVFQLIKDGLKE